MNPLMDILRQQRASKRPGYRYGAPVGNPMGGTANSSSSSSNSSSSNSGLGAQYGLGAGEDAPGTGTYAGAQGLGINSNPNLGNPHLDVPNNVPSVDPDPGTDESPEKNQWWSKFTKNLREDVTDFFSPTNVQRGLLGLITSMINPAGAIGLNGLVAMGVNMGLINSMIGPTQSEVAQSQVDEAQANMDVAHDAGTEQAMRDAMASLSAAQASEAEATAAAAEAADNEHGEGRPGSAYYLANNPYQQNPLYSSSYQGGMGPPPDYSQYVLSHEEQSMADGLEAIGYMPHTAIQYAMHYYNNPEAPVFT